MKAKTLRRWGTKALCTLLAALLLAGCGPKDGGNTPGAPDAHGTGAMGRWVESEVNLPGDFAPTALYQLASGEIWLLAVDQQTMRTSRLVSSDGGESWQQSPLPAPLDESIILDVSPGGAVLAAHWAMPGEEGGTTYWKLAPGGEPEPFSLPDLPEPLTLSPYFITEDALAIAWMAMAGDAPLPGQSSGAEWGIGTSSVGEADIDDTDPDAAPDGENAPDEDEVKTGVFNVDGEGGVIYSTQEPNGSITVHGSGIYSFADGRRLADWPDMGGDALSRTGSNGEKLFYEQYGTGFMAMDAAGGQQLVYSGSGAGHLDAVSAGPDGTLWFANEKGIHRLAAGGNLVETVVESSAFAFTRPNSMGQAMARTEAGDYLLLLTDYNSADYASTLYRYHFDERLPARGETVLTVWSLNDNNTVRAAIAAFAAARPEVEVEYTVAQPDGQEGPDKEELLRALNTELLAGGGPDLLILDGTNHAAYARQGLLADVSGMVSDIALLESITGPFTENGALYVLPVRFQLPVLIAPEERLAKASDWAGMIGAFLDAPARPDRIGDEAEFYEPLPAGERYAFSVKDTADLVDMLLSTSAPALLNGAGDGLDAAALGEFYTAIEQVARHYDLGSYRPADPMMDITTILSVTGEDPVINHQSGMEYDFGRSLYGREWLATPVLFYNIEPRGVEESPVIALQPGLTEGAYQPSVLAAVNAASTSKELAGEFLRTMLSDEVQGAAFDFDGLPVTQSGMQIMEARFKEGRHYEDALLENFHALLAAAKTPVLVNDTLRGAVETHALAIAKGTETVEDAVAGTQKDLELYFAERG